MPFNCSSLKRPLQIPPCRGSVQLGSGSQKRRPKIGGGIDCSADGGHGGGGGGYELANQAAPEAAATMVNSAG